jgi:hypothetical protein
VGVIGNFFRDFLILVKKFVFHMTAQRHKYSVFLLHRFLPVLKKMFLVFIFGGTKTTGCLLYEYKIKSGKKYFVNIISVKKTFIRVLPNFAADVLWRRQTTCGHFDYLFLQVSYATKHL